MHVCIRAYLAFATLATHPGERYVVSLRAADATPGGKPVVEYAPGAPDDPPFTINGAAGPGTLRLRAE